MANLGGLKVYFDLMSQPSRAVVLFLKVNKIPFTAKTIALRKGEHFGEEYTKINPFQLVPAIDDDGFKLTESVAILKYLSDKYQVPDHWYPKNLQRRALVDRYMAWQHLNLRLFGSMVFRTQLIDPRMTNKPINKEKLAEHQVHLDRCLNQIESIFLPNSSFLAGDEISIADLLGICELMQPVTTGHNVFQGRPLLESWAKRVQDKLQPHFGETHVQLFRVKELFALGKL